MRQPLLLLISILILASPAVAATITVDFLPALYVFDAGAGGHLMNNYTMVSDQDTTGGSWSILGSDNRIEFAHLDARNLSFSAGVQQQFNISSLSSYRYFYLILHSGFSIGSTLEFHYNHTTPAQSPQYTTTSIYNFTVERPGSQNVILFDFNQTASGVTIGNYSIRSSDTLSNLQSWVLVGTNTSEIIGYSDHSIFTTVDLQSSEGFTANTWRTFELSTSRNFRYYVLYFTDGWDTAGTQVDIKFESGTPATPHECTTPATEPGAIPIEAMYILLPLAMGMTIYAVWNFDNRIYANIVLGGFFSSVLWYFIAGNVITGNLFYSHTDKYCIVSDVPLFWLLVLMGVVVSLYTLTMAWEAIVERRMAGLDND